MPVETLELDSFNEADVCTFAGNFFRGGPRESAVYSFLRESSTIPELRGNPLMLSVLCSLYEAGRRLPANRAEPYGSCATMLFEVWDERCDLRSAVAHEDIAEAATLRLAFDVFSAGEEEFTSELVLSVIESSLAESLGARGATTERLARAILDKWLGRQWLLTAVGTRKGQDYLRFSHRTFLEYFAALHFVRRSSSDDELATILLHRMRSREGLNQLHLIFELCRKSRPSLPARLMGLFTVEGVEGAGASVPG